MYIIPKKKSYQLYINHIGTLIIRMIGTAQIGQLFWMPAKHSSLPQRT